MERITVDKIKELHTIYKIPMSNKNIILHFHILQKRFFMKYLLLTLVLLFSCSNSSDPSDKDGKVQGNNIIQIEMGGTYEGVQTETGKVYIFTEYSKEEISVRQYKEFEGCYIMNKTSTDPKASIFAIGQDDKYYYFNEIDITILKNPTDNQTDNGFYYNKDSDGNWDITHTRYGNIRNYYYRNGFFGLLPTISNSSIKYWTYKW